MTATKAELPPMARGLPVAGSALDLMGDVRAFLTEQYLELGPVFRVRAFNRGFTALAGPDANLFVTKKGREFLRSEKFWADFVDDLDAKRILIGMDGDDHTRLRGVQKRGYSRSFILDNIAEATKVARREISDWPLDTPVPALFSLQRIATDQLGSLAAGMSSRDYLDDMIVFVRTLLMARLTRHRPALVLRMPRFRNARRRIEDLASTVLASHDPESRGGESQDLVDDLVALHDMDPEFMPSVDLRAAALGPFIAGLDTVGSTSAFMLYALLKRPDLMERVRDEADRLFEGGVPDAEGMRQLDVTHRVAMETMRMYPIAPALTRTAAKTFKFGGYTIREGEDIIVGTTVSHYLPEFFPNPERFDIDRYTPVRREHRQPGAFAPFGVGAHICLGAGFAEVAIAITIAAILHQTELELTPPDYELKIDYAPTAHPNDNFQFRVKRFRN